MLQTQMQRRRSQSVRQTRPQRVLRFAVLQIIASMQRRFLLDGRQWIKGSLSGVQTKIEYYPIAFASACHGIVITDAYGYNQVGAEVLNNTSFKIYTTNDIGYFALLIGN